LLVSDIENGMFVLRKNETLPPPAPPSGNPQPPRPGAGGGGGGGAVDPTLLILFAGLAMLRGRRKTPL